MNTNEQQRLDPETARPERAPVKRDWRADRDARDKLSEPRPLREPRLNDGDLLHGDGP
jgi:hypothetical protein